MFESLSNSQLKKGLAAFALAFGLAPGMSVGTTLSTPEPSEFAEILADPASYEVSSILTLDPLGFECVRQEHLHAAFQMRTTSARLQRTCLPDPCEAALSRVELDGLIGRPATRAEWDDYYARYADTCRRETTPFNIEEPFPGTDPNMAGGRFADFWRPLVSTYPEGAPIRTQIATRSPRPDRFPPLVSIFPGSGYPVGVPDIRQIIVGSPDDEGGGALPPPPPLTLVSSGGDAVVLATPVPASLWAMLLALAGASAAALRARRRRTG